MMYSAVLSSSYSVVFPSPKTGTVPSFGPNTGSISGCLPGDKSLICPHAHYSKSASFHPLRPVNILSL